MKEEKTVSLKETFIFLIGNKWLYLIMFVSFLAVSLVGFNIASSYKREYSSFFDCNIAGFHSDVNEKESYFIDGEKFEPRSLLTREKVKGYLACSYLFDGLTAEQLEFNGGFKSFEFKTTYKEIEDNDGNIKRVLDKQGYEIVFNSSVVNVEQAKLLSQMIANEVVTKSNKKIEKYRFGSYLDSYNQEKGFDEKVKSLTDGINNLIAQTDSLKLFCGNFNIEANKYGGIDERYYLSSETIDDWETNMKDDLTGFDVDSLSIESRVKGYIDPNYPEYIEYLEVSVEDLNREIAVNEEVLAYLKLERDNVITLSGSEENVQISEFNNKIIDLTEKIAKQKEQARIYNLKLQKLDPTFIASEEYAEYSTDLNTFKNKLASLYEKLKFYTDQYEAIAKKAMIDNSNTHFENPSIITINAGMRTFPMLVYSLLIAAFLPMGINGCVAVFKMLDSKPLFRKKSKEE